MRDKMIKAARAHAEGQLALHKVNIEVYLTNPAGIGEHPDVMEALQSELDKMAEAHDRLEMIKLLD